MYKCDQPDLSFIIPIYNTEKKQVVRCVNSITKLTGITYEVLMVNDGSDKLKSNEYEKIAKKYSFRYFYNINKGVSYARNFGLQKANGKYVFFLDSDDYILAKNIRKEDIKSNSDLIIYQVKMNVAGQNDFQLFSLDSNFRNSTEVLLKLALKDGLMNWACGKLFKLSFLQKNNLNFDPKRVSGEDLNFVIRVLYENPDISYVSRVAYIYLLDNKTNITRMIRYPDKVLQDIIAMLDIRLNILQKLNIDNKTYYLEMLKKQSLKSVFEVYAAITYNHRNNADIQEQLRLNIKKIRGLTSKKNLLLSFKEKVIENDNRKAAICYIKIRKIYRKMNPFKL